VICKYNQNNGFKRIEKRGSVKEDKKFFSLLSAFRGVEKDKKTFVNIFSIPMKMVVQTSVSKSL